MRNYSVTSLFNKTYFVLASSIKWTHQKNFRALKPLFKKVRNLCIKNNVNMQRNIDIAIKYF